MCIHCMCYDTLYACAYICVRQYIRVHARTLTYTYIHIIYIHLYLYSENIFSLPLSLPLLYLFTPLGVQALLLRVLLHRAPPPIRRPPLISQTRA